MNLEFTDSEGRKRKGFLTNCGSCGKSFPTRIDQPAKYCSAVCRGSAFRKVVEVCCGHCGKVILKKPSALRCSRSGYFFCDRNCKEDAQRAGLIKEILPPHYGTSSGGHSEQYRKYYKECSGDTKLICKRCGYSEFECGVDIHHINENRKDNSFENLKPLCACCHKALHNGLWKLGDLGP